MKKRNILLIVQILLVSLSLLAQPDTIAPQETIASTDSISSPFSSSTKAALLATDITVFKVSDFKAAAGTDNLLEEFEIFQQELLSVEQSSFLCDMLLENQHYFFTNKIKQCLFLPQMGIQFAGEIDTVNVLVSFDCGMIRYYHNGQFNLYYINDQMDPLLKFVDDLFPAPVPSSEIPEADETVAESLAETPGFSIMAYIPACDYTTQAGPFGAKESAFRVNTPASNPIFYILKEGEQADQLPQIVKDECNLSVDKNQICQLNNLTEIQFKNLAIGTTLIVGYQAID